MTQTDYQTPAYLLEKLGEALRSQQSGTFFVATSDNASCRLCLVQGHITHCSYQRLHGKEALQAFSSIKAGRCSLSPNPYPFRPHDAVEHAQAIALLDIRLMPTKPTPITEPDVAAQEPKAPTNKNKYYRGYVAHTQEAAQPPPKDPPPTITHNSKNKYYRGYIAQE